MRRRRARLHLFRARAAAGGSAVDAALLADTASDQWMWGGAGSPSCGVTGLGADGGAADTDAELDDPLRSRMTSRTYDLFHSLW
ncbi:hypothetical protein GCM10010303_83060 [Streptomyces purpurascens]|nr:hypothetical protein GCM10010303_83060 [Streptomyces purpurascens]